jgi:hypothetical protein
LRHCGAFTLGNHPQPGETNILFSGHQTGNPITGFTNTGHVEVDFSSSTNADLDGPSGQAQITNADGNNLTEMTVKPAVSFTDFIVDLNGGPHVGDVVDVSVTASDGTHSFVMPDVANGSNFITIVSSGGVTMSQVSFTAAVNSPTTGWNLFKQPRVSGLVGVIPEPSTWAMMIIGFVGLGFVGYRKTKSARTALVDA